MVPQILCTTYLLEYHGFEVKASTFYQDNMSAMLLEKNRMASSTKRTKHINVWYFFIKDKVESGEVTIEHCGTNDMIADYFTKPLQGKKFKEFRDRIMGCVTVGGPEAVKPVMLKSKAMIKPFFKTAGIKAERQRPAGVCWSTVIIIGMERYVARQ